MQFLTSEFSIFTLATYISDHKLIKATLEFTPDRIVQNEHKVRNLKNLDMEKFMDTLHLPEICKLETVELIWTEFCTNIQSGLDTSAPLKSIKMGTKNNKLWYDNDLRQQRRKVKNGEGIFRKYGEQHQWQAFKSEGNKYSRMLIDVKTKFFQNKISENKKDKKVLYNIVSSTIGANTENPMLPGNSNIEIVNSFANFFINKIQNIRDKLETYSHFEPIHKDITIPLNCFREISKEELVKLVNSLDTKSCELDPLPAWFIKKNLEEFLDVLLKLVNTSLTNSEYISDWKLAIL